MDKVKKFFKSVYGILVVVAFLIGLLLYWEPLQRFFRSDKKNDDADKYYKGELLLPRVDLSKLAVSDSTEFSQTFVSKGYGDKLHKIKDTVPIIKGILVDKFADKKVLKIYFGDTLITADAQQLLNGLSLKPNGCGNFIIRLGIRNSRLYVATEFRDLQKDEFVGEIIYNKWKLLKANMLDYHSDDHSLMVLDKQNHTIFDLVCYDVELTEMTLVLRGYFLSSEGIAIINNEGLNMTRLCIPKTDKDWKQKAETYIERIPKTFNVPLTKEINGTRERTGFRSYPPSYIYPKK